MSVLGQNNSHLAEGKSLNSHIYGACVGNMDGRGVSMAGSGDLLL